MRLIFTLVGLLFLQLSSAQPLTSPVNINDGEQNHIYDGGTTRYIRIRNNSKVTINGDVTVDDYFEVSGFWSTKRYQVFVEEGSVLVINGNLTIEMDEYGIDELIVNGTLVVTGNLNVTNTRGDADINIAGKGVLVVGGTYDANGDSRNWWGEYEEESNSGDVFLGNPSDGNGFDGSGDEGNLDDLINANPPVLADDLLDLFLENTAVVWEGGLSNAWEEKGNWKDEKQPKSHSRIIIEKLTGGNDAKITAAMGEVSLCDVKLSSGKLIIGKGAKVTVLRDAKTNNKLQVNSSNAAPSSFICKGNITGNVIFKNTYASMRWWFIGHPIANPKISSYDALKSNGNDYRLQAYNGSKMANAGIGTNPMDGYALAIKNGENNTITHKGTLVTGDQSKELTGSDDPNSDGWNLVANPFVSYYQLPIDADGFENTVGTIYVPTNNADNSGRTYATYNTKSGITTPKNTITDGVLAPNQCFYIKVVGDNQTLYMREANRLHPTSNASLKSSAPTENDVLRIKLNNGVSMDEAVIAFRENGQLEYSRLDSEQKVAETLASYIYSIKDDVNTVINVLPQSGSTSIPLGMIFKEGSHTINIDGLNTLSSSTDIVLEDKELGVSTPLSNGEQYSFTTTAITNNTRFVLHLNKAEVPTAIEDELVEDEETNDVNIYLQNQSTLIVNCNWTEAEKQVNVYSVSGAQVFNASFSGTEFTENLAVQSGIYIVKVTAGSKHYETKVMVK